MNKIREWIDAMFHGTPRSTQPDLARKRLTERQLDVADRLADMKGVTRDQVLAEAYRRVARLSVEADSVRRQH